MESDVHHRTEAFRKIYTAVLADLKEVFALRTTFCRWSPRAPARWKRRYRISSRAAIRLSCARQESSASAGPKSPKPTAWMPPSYSAEYGDVVSADQVADTLDEGQQLQRCFRPGFGDFYRRGARRQRHGRAIKKTDALFVVDAITGLGTQPLDIDGWGLDVVVGGSQKSFMIPPGLAFLSVSEKAWSRADSSNLPKYYFNLKKERKNAAAGESSWTPNTSLIIALGEALKYIKSIGMDKLIENAQLLARATREAGGRPRPGAVRAEVSRAPRLLRSARRRAWTPASS